MQKAENQENQILYDWVSITSKIDSPQTLIELLGLNREGVVWEQVKGMHGYMDRLTFGGVNIHYNGREDMGVWLEMSGQGCRTFESFGSGDYDGLFRYVLENPEELHITRLDVAFDDHSGILDMEQLKVDTLNDSYISKWSGGSARIGHGESRGQDTIEFGSMKSAIFLRIYNKAAERGFSDRHWLRVELQMRDERARSFLSRMGRSAISSLVCSEITSVISKSRTVQIRTAADGPQDHTGKNCWELASGFLCTPSPELSITA